LREPLAGGHHNGVGNVFEDHETLPVVLGMV
jgi:hypothetical protein